MLDLAQELVDGGASARREARTLFATGLRVRGRRYLEGMRFAPWSEARRLVVLWSTALIAAFLITSSGGWLRYDSGSLGNGFADLEHWSRSAMGGWSLLVLVGAAAATAAARMRLAAGLLLVAALVALQTWIVTPAFFGVTSINLGVSHVDGIGPVDRWFVITTGGFVGLLALLAFLAASIDGLRTTRAPVPRGRAIRTFVLWVVGVAVLPLAGRILWNAIDRWAVPTLEPGGPIPMLLLWATAAAALLAAIALPRIKPAFAVAAMLLTVAYVIPIYWTVFGSMVVLTSPLAHVIFGNLAAFWGSAALVAIGLGLTVPACAGHAAVRRGVAERPAPRRASSAG